MAIRKVKSAPKQFISNKKVIEEIVVSTMSKIAEIVGSTLGPGGRVVMLESDLPNLPNRITKDGVSVFKELGAIDPYEQLVIETARDAAIRTANQAGDGTTTATILAYELVKNLLAFCRENAKFSPQKAMRIINTCIKQKVLPEITKRAIKVNQDNKQLLEKVAIVSTNGDREMAKSVIEAFETVGYGDSSHVTIQEMSGPQGYEVELIEGFPISMGYEESVGKFHTAFINDQSNLRCALDNPLFILFDGVINDLMSVTKLLDKIGDEYQQGNSDYKNVVLVAHGFSESVLTSLAFNFSNPVSINVFPLRTPINQMLNSRQHFLMDLSAFTGAKIFDMTHPVADAQPEDLGKGMTVFEAYRFRSNLVGDPDPVNIEVRADELKSMIKNPESTAEKIILEERLGKLTNGIARLKIFGGSSGKLREKHDRVEDAICAVRNSITYGCLPGGGRILLDLSLKILDNKFMPKLIGCTKEEYRQVMIAVLSPALASPVQRLLENAGYCESEINDIVTRLCDSDEIFDIEQAVFNKLDKSDIYDAFGAVFNAIENSISIASVLGTSSGIVCYPRDDVMERSEAKAERDFNNACDNPGQYTNEADARP
jgi:chaperonin GroEL